MKLALTVSLVTLTLAGAALAEDAPDAGAAPAPKAAEPPPRPAERVWNVAHEADGRKHTVGFKFKPGILAADQVAEVTLELNEVPKTAHPRFGMAVPYEGRVVAELRDPSGAVVGRYLAHKVPLSQGRYALHLTPNQDGLFTLSVLAEMKEGKSLEVEAKVPVNVWPLPPELEGTGAKEGGSRRPVR